MCFGLVKHFGLTDNNIFKSIKGGVYETVKP